MKSNKDLINQAKMVVSQEEPDQNGVFKLGGTAIIVPDEKIQNYQNAMPGGSFTTKNGTKYTILFTK